MPACFTASFSNTDPWLGCLQAGIDEVGIGPLAGPVIAAAVLLDVNRPIVGLQDSKVMTAKRRERLATLIKQHALDWAIGSASVAEIDQLNILQASHLAMRRALDQLTATPAMVLVDGNKTPNVKQPCIAVVRGDRRVPQISAASIVAKVCRDDLMARLALQYPGYGFAQHKGYPTRAHLSALSELGVCPEHRRSFAPVQRCLDNRALAQGEIELAESL